ncbi:MAG: sigma-E processing peptidase SpoIIGA [Oscillospiraceae bacterium]|nr:sigma-E processing peptidase SpoIIGA [Oscillospiraceae bacterium]
MEVYLDLVVILNFLVDLLLLLGTNRLAGFPTDWKRTLAAAALGSIYSGACVLPGFRFLGNLLWRAVSFLGMAVLAFGWNRSAVKRGGVFLLLALALGGIAEGFDRANIPALLLAAGGMWLLCRVAFGDGIGQEYVPITLTYEGNRVELTALRDSGNTLRDPITGEQVLVIGSDAARRLTGLTEAQLRSPLETLTLRPLLGLRLIPYCAVGQGGGFLLGMRFSDVKIGPKTQSAVVAFAAEGLGRGEMVQALTGGAL